MEEEQIKELLVAVTNHDSRITEIYHRMKAQETQIMAINDLSLSVRELAVNMSSMVSEQKSQGERITRLERAPVARYESVIYMLVSALSGTLFGYIFNLL